MIYLQLFVTFFKIGLFCFGGGFAIISMIQQEVMRLDWMTQPEFVDIVAISQMTPGPIGINVATYVGYTAADGVLGSVVATTAIMLPSLIIMMILCRIYMKMKNNRYVENVLRFLRFSVLGLIAAAALSLMTPATFIDYWSWILCALVFCGTVFLRWHPILLICLSGIAGYLIYSPIW